MTRHSFPLVESIKVVRLSEGRTIRVLRDRTKDNLKVIHGDGDIHLTCVAQAHDPIEMLKTLAKTLYAPKRQLASWNSSPSQRI